MHDDNMQLDGLVMFESFIVDSKRGIKPMNGFEDVKDGSWFGSFYVENPQAWDLIKQGKVKGFSVEGMFDYVLPTKTPEQQLQELAALLKVPFFIKLIYTTMTAKEILDRTAQFFTELMQPAQDASGTPAAPQKMMEAKVEKMALRLKLAKWQLVVLLQLLELLHLLASMS